MKRIEKHPCISDGLGLESVGHEDGGPWKLVVRATRKFLAIVRYCPWCGVDMRSMQRFPVKKRNRRGKRKR